MKCFLYQFMKVFFCTKVRIYFCPILGPITMKTPDLDELIMGDLSDEGRARLAKLTEVEPANRPLPSTPLYSGLLNFAVPFINIITRLKISGMEHIPRTGPLIVAANHLSHLDPVLAIFSSRRKLFYLAKNEHLEICFSRKFPNRSEG